MNHVLNQQARQQMQPKRVDINNGHADRKTRKENAWIRRSERQEQNAWREKKWQLI